MSSLLLSVFLLQLAIHLINSFGAATINTVVCTVAESASMLC